MGQVEIGKAIGICIRVSTEVQDEERQVASAKAWLRRHGLDSSDTGRVRWYRDIGYKRAEPERRPEFQRLIADAEAGRVNTIYVDSLDRMETGRPNSTLGLVARLQDAGVKLYNEKDRELTADDIGTTVETAVSSDASRRELREKSDRVISQKMLLAKRGEWQGGFVPFGLDVVCLTGPVTAPQELWRVQFEGRNQRLKVLPSGDTQRYDGVRNFPSTEVDQRLELRPTTRAEQLEWVVKTFRAFRDEKISYAMLAKRLAQSGLHPYYAEHWMYYHIRDLLQNPVYVGLPTWNKSTQGGYYEVVGGQRRLKTSGGRRSFDRHERSEWIQPEVRLFEPIVDPQLFADVQEKIKGLPPAQRAPRSADHWLSGLLFCGHCGKPLRGFKRASGNGVNEYVCGSYSQRTPGHCPRHAVTHRWAEEVIRKYLSDKGQELGELLTGRTDKPGPDLPSDFAENYAQQIGARLRMIQRVVKGKKGADKLAATLGLLPFRPPADMPSVPPPPDRLVEKYKQVFESEAPALRKRLALLEAEHDKLTFAFVKAPDGALADKIKAAAEKLETEMAAVRRDLLDESARSEAFFQQCERLWIDWEAARNAAETDADARVKAATVSRVIKRIDLFFRPTGRLHPKHEVARYEIHPCVNRSREEYPKKDSCLPAPALP